MKIEMTVVIPVELPDSFPHDKVNDLILRMTFPESSTYVGLPDGTVIPDAIIGPHYETIESIVLD